MNSVAFAIQAVFKQTAKSEWDDDEEDSAATSTPVGIISTATISTSLKN